MHGIEYGVTTTIGADRWCQHCGRPANRLVMVEYVPRGELTGAVEAFREVERELALLYATYGDDTPGWEVLRVQQLARTATRGQ